MSARIRTRRRAASRGEGAAIRAADILLAAALIAVLSPLLVIIAAAIRLSDGGPALFRQQRVGRGRALFMVAKFRTMRLGAARPGNGAPAHRTGPGDPRITALGRVLRPSHLDELPQLFNVLLGHMSMVGVRPDTPMQRSDYSREYWEERHRFAPGITGPAQVAPGDQTLDQRSGFERQWLAGRSVGMYLRVLWQTIGKVFARSSH